MEAGVNEAFADVCRSHGMDWSGVLPELQAASRYHVETY
jgi:benzoyl-CoA 2,3-dioxygenase component A